MNKIRNEWYAKSFSARKIGIYILGSSEIEMCLKAEIACKKERKGKERKLFLHGMRSVLH